MLCTEVLSVKVSKLDERNLIEDSMYREVSVNISNFRISDLHEVLEVDPVIILIILFSCTTSNHSFVGSCRFVLVKNIVSESTISKLKVEEDMLL